MDLNVYTDDEGYPWCAFVWGKHDPKEVAPLITESAVEYATGFNSSDLKDAHVDWPPNVSHFHLRCGGDDESDRYGDFDEVFFFCAADHPDAQIVTGHKFNP